MVVLDGGPCGATGRGGLGFFIFIGLNGVFLKQKCIRLMLEKLKIFLYRQYIVENICSLAFQRNGQIHGQSWDLQENLKNVTVLS